MSENRARNRMTTKSKSYGEIEQERTGVSIGDTDRAPGRLHHGSAHCKTTLMSEKRQRWARFCSCWRIWRIREGVPGTTAWSGTKTLQAVFESQDQGSG